MKTVINALPFKQQSSGIGILIGQLFGRLPKYKIGQWLTLLSRDSPPFGVGDVKGEQHRIPFQKRQNIRRNLYQLFIMGGRFCKNAVFLTTDSKIPLIMPRSAKIISVITDLAVYRMPEVYQRSRVLYWRLQFQYLLRRAVRFIAISEHTKRDMVELLHIAPEQIDVVPCAAEPALCRVADVQALTLVRERYELPESYVLFVGNFNPRKNLERLLLAFDKLCDETSLPHKLVIAGEHGWRFHKDSALAGLRHRDRVVFAGYVADEDMAALYTMADLFAFPTLYEGFGIPILEAQQCGAPVLAGNSSAMPEVGGAGAVYTDALDTDAIYRDMRCMLEDDGLRNTLRERGYANASHFSWEASAARLCEILQRL